MYQEENQPQKQEPTSPLKYGLKYLKKYRTKLAFAIFWSILFVIIPMQVPVITGTLVDGLTINNSRNDKPLLFYGLIEVGKTAYEVLSFSFISLIILAISYGIASHLRISLRAIVSRNFAFELQRILVRKLEFLSLDIHTKHGSGDLLNRAIIDANNLRPFVEATIIKSITNVARISYPLVMLFVIDPFIALVASSILPAQYFIIKSLQSKISEVSRQLRNDKARLTMLIKEDLDSIETIQTSNAETYSLQKISNQIERVEEARTKGQRYYAMMMGFAVGLTGLGVALTWWLGGLSVISGDMTLGQLIIFSGFVLFAYTPVRRLTQIVKDHHRGIVAIRHIQEILEEPSSIKEDENPRSLEICHGTITLRNVSFSFNKEQKRNPVLNNININIEPKRITAIIGSSGSGKSSILRLITRLYDPSEGQMLIDGQDLKKVSIQSLRSQIAVVPQSPVIFTGSIIENIRVASPNASDTEVKQACWNADASKFINKFEKGLDTIIGKGGIYLSVGQAQRIAIARALLKKKAKILLLDEPNSAIDPESAKSIMNTLHKLKKEMTIVLVAHDREAIDKVDNVITIDNGKVVEIVENGTTKEIEVGNGAHIIFSQKNLNYIYAAGDTSNSISVLKMRYPLRNFVFEKPVNQFGNINRINDNNGVTADINTNTDTISTNISKQERESFHFFEYKMIGRSVNKRGINVVFIGERINPQLKIFVMAGQHGDEKYSCKAAERLISYLWRTRAKDFAPNVCIAILPNANPDGSHKHTRRTADAIDMNRDHVILTSEENRVIHSFIRSWKPNLIIDLHNYPPIRKYLKRKNYIFYHDILIDTASNLAIQKRLDQDELKGLIQGIQSDLNQFNYSAERYALIDREGKVRHSTHDIVDARNFFSLRYNTFTILLEAREPLRKDGKNERERTISAQYQALLSILKWATKCTDFLLDKSSLPSYKKGDRIPIRSNYILSEQPFKMNFKNTITKQIEEVTLPKYRSDIKATKHVRLPSAYAVPEVKNSIIEFLHNHGFASERIKDDSKLQAVQKYLILSLGPPKSDGKSAKKVVTITNDEKKDLSNYEIFSVNQEGGHSLALLLEPQSGYGLHKYSDLSLSLEPGLEYPILRVV
jgi:ABC-type multidrug transport system fused ATPase/permease subunit